MTQINSELCRTLAGFATVRPPTTTPLHPFGTGESSIVRVADVGWDGRIGHALRPVPRCHAVAAMGTGPALDSVRGQD